LVPIKELQLDVFEFVELRGLMLSISANALETRRRGTFKVDKSTSEVFSTTQP
jgi:hypothetical protein